MRSTRINPIIVGVVGAILCLGTLGGLFYFLVLPTQAKVTAAHGRYDAAYPDSTPAAQSAAKLQVTQAVAAVAATKAQWAVYENTIMPRYDVSQRFTAWKQLSNELALNLGPDITRYYRKTGVVRLSAITLPAPPADPNAITAAPLVIPIGGSSSGGGGGGGGFTGGSSGGAMAVGGSFRSILHHIELWNSFNRLVEVDSLTLHGNSPYMEGDYGASVIIFPQNDDKLDKPIPAASAGTTTGGGFPGGRGG